MVKKIASLWCDEKGQCNATDRMNDMLNAHCRRLCACAVFEEVVKCEKFRNEREFHVDWCVLSQC